MNCSVCGDEMALYPDTEKMSYRYYCPDCDNWEDNE